VPRISLDADSNLERFGHRPDLRQQKCTENAREGQKSRFVLVEAVPPAGFETAEMKRSLLRVSTS
jgi:hypothetical protein